MKKILCFLSVILFASFFLCACQDTSDSLLPEFPYSAKLFDKAENLLKEEFLVENETHYPSREDGLPDSRCQIINNDDEFSCTIATFPEELNFSQDMLVIYLFTDIYYGFECKLYEIIENEEKLSIVIKHEMAENNAGLDIPSTSMPIQRCLIVKLSNCSFDNVEIKLIYS